MISALINRGIGFNTTFPLFELTLGLSIGPAIPIAVDIIFTDPGRSLVFTNPGRSLVFTWNSSM